MEQTDQLISLATYEQLQWLFSTGNAVSYFLFTYLCYRWLSIVGRNRRARIIFSSLVCACAIIAIARAYVAVYFDSYLVRLMIPITHTVSNYAVLYLFYRATVYFEDLHSKPAASTEAINATEEVWEGVVLRVLNDEPITSKEIRKYKTFEIHNA